MIDLSKYEQKRGVNRTIPTIDGKYVKFVRSGPVQYGSSETFPGLGMPIGRQQGTRGNLIISLYR